MATDWVTKTDIYKSFELVKKSQLSSAMCTYVPDYVVMDASSVRVDWAGFVFLCWSVDWNTELIVQLVCEQCYVIVVYRVVAASWVTYFMIVMK